MEVYYVARIQADARIQAEQLYIIFAREISSLFRYLFHPIIYHLFVGISPNWVFTYHRIMASWHE